MHKPNPTPRQVPFFQLPGFNAWNGCSTTPYWLVKRWPVQGTSVQGK